MASATPHVSSLPLELKKRVDPYPKRKSTAVFNLVSQFSVREFIKGGMGHLFKTKDLLRRRDYPDIPALTGERPIILPLVEEYSKYVDDFSNRRLSSFLTSFGFIVLGYGVDTSLKTSAKTNGLYGEWTSRHHNLLLIHNSSSGNNLIVHEDVHYCSVLLEKAPVEVDISCEGLSLTLLANVGDITFKRCKAGRLILKDFNEHSNTVKISEGYPFTGNPLSHLHHLALRDSEKIVKRLYELKVEARNNPDVLEKDLLKRFSKGVDAIKKKFVETRNIETAFEMTEGFKRLLAECYEERRLVLEEDLEALRVKLIRVGIDL
jgi:hypothetical protein